MQNQLAMTSIILAAVMTAKKIFSGFSKRIALVLAVLALPVVLTGCSGVSYILENYSDVEDESFLHDNRYFYIFDKPEEGKMMITASYSSAAMMGFVEGLTLGIADTDYPGPVYREAGEAYLRKQGKDCQVIRTELLATPQWELEYTCQ